MQSIVCNLRENTIVATFYIALCLHGSTEINRAHTDYSLRSGNCFRATYSNLNGSPYRLNIMAPGRFS